MVQQQCIWTDTQRLRVEIIPFCFVADLLKLINFTFEVPFQMDSEELKQIS